MLSTELTTADRAAPYVQREVVAAGHHSAAITVESDSPDGACVAQRWPCMYMTATSHGCCPQIQAIWS